jgi:hypothetical protein
MKLLNNIWVASFLLLTTVNVNGQDVQGSVVVHSDPRLSLLVKKSHNMDPMASSVVMHRSSVKTHTQSDVIPAKVSSKTSRVSSAAVVVSSASTETKKSAVKINSDDASSTGHAGGWSPPVHRKARAVYSGKGFRVQIYNGPDRKRALEIKTEFMRSYPGMRTYLTYVSPCFRVKVGDYRSRNEALGMLREANSIYSPCMIVPDIITICTF